jgi:hypothetical protein
VNHSMSNEECAAQCAAQPTIRPDQFRMLAQLCFASVADPARANIRHNVFLPSADSKAV